MGTWVLIIWLTALPGGEAANAVASVPGFSSVLTCNSAAIKMTTENDRYRGDAKILTICVQQ